MGTRIRADLSPKNKWWISKHRYYELKHFCLQYDEWVESYKALKLYPEIDFTTPSYGGFKDCTYEQVERSLYFKSLIDLVETSCKASDEFIAAYILKAVTKDLSYVQLKMQYDIPCGKDMYYDRYRKFFYILDARKKQLPL